MPTNPTTTGERFKRLVGIMAKLRAPGGCPWDREQSFDTIKPYLLEGTYEVLEAIDTRVQHLFDNGLEARTRNRCYHDIVR